MSGKMWHEGRRLQQKDLAFGEPRPEPSFTGYEKVAALLLSWHQDIDDLLTDFEVTELEEVFMKTFGYTTTRAILTNDAIRSAQIQVNKHLSDFVFEHDGGNTLLIIYYAGQSRPGDERGILHLRASTALASYGSSERHEIVWNSAEVNIKDTTADVLVIFDCCYAGDLELSVRPPRAPLPQRAFEFLAATSAQSTTRKPGPRSFTSALIHALKRLVKDDSFSTQELVHAIKSAPGFPGDQWPRLHERQASRRKIVLSALNREPVKEVLETSQRELSDRDTTFATNSIFSSPSLLNSSQDGDFSTSRGGNNLRAVSTLPSSAPESHGNSQKRDVEIQNPHLGQSPAQSTTLEIIDDEEDKNTLYSFVTESSDESDGWKYQAHLGQELFSYISSFSHNENDISRLAKGIPELLQIFTRKLGSESSAQVYRDIMRYVHKHRLPITKKITDLLDQNCLQEDDIPIKSRSDDVFYQTKVHDWQAKYLDQKLDNFPVEENMFEGVKGEDDDEDDDISPALADFRRVVETSAAYSWLLQALKHDLQHSIPGDSHIAQVRTAILSRDAFRRVSRGSPPVTCNAEYIVDWDPVGFIRSQEYDQPPKDVVIKALTLTGNPTEAEALTCGNYISRTWPQSGHQFLSLLQALLESETGTRQQVILEDGTSMTGLLRDTDCIFEVTGKVDTVVEIGEQISWISCALRNSDIEGAAICTPALRSFTETGRTASSVSLKLEISADIAPIELGVNDQGFCWRSLFRSPLLVQGYPIARRSSQDAGLEMSLNTMMALTQARRITPFKRRLFVKGHSTMLIATKEVSGVVLWHVITNEDGHYIYYHDERVKQCLSTLEDSVLSSEFSAKRHVVGWWSQVKSLAGTSGAELNILGSGLPSPGLGFAFDKVTVGGGKFVSVSLGIALGKRDKPVQSHKEGFYSDQIRQALTKYVVLYDINEHRAWLVDGATALLHIVRASLVADEKNGFRLLHKNHDIQEEGDITESSAVRTLTNEHNMHMTLCEEPGEEDSEIETKRLHGGSDPGKTEVTVKYKATYSRFSDRVKRVYSVLDDIFNHQCDMSSDGVGLKVSASPLQQLEGFDFKDISHGVKTLHPKALSLGWKGMGWVDLLRDLHAITLFGRGFGDLLEPNSGHSSLCTDWSRVPRDLNYLAVSNMTLQRILENQGEQDQTPRLVAWQLYWHCPDKYCEGCTKSQTDLTTTAQGCHCDRVQVILPRTIFNTRRCRSPTQIPPGGGTIFGHSRKYPLRWTTSHSATETKVDSQPPSIAVDQTHGNSDLLLPTPSDSATSRSSSPFPSLSITTAASTHLKRFGAFLKRSKQNKNTS